MSNNKFGKCAIIFHAITGKNCIIDILVICDAEVPKTTFGSVAFLLTASHLNKTSYLYYMLKR